VESYLVRGLVNMARSTRDSGLILHRSPIRTVARSGPIQVCRIYVRRVPTSIWYISISLV
jgi:hypothetical protein